jgi:hypothetical protein
MPLTSVISGVATVLPDLAFCCGATADIPPLFEAPVRAERSPPQPYRWAQDAGRRATAWVRARTRSGFALVAPEGVFSGTRRGLTTRLSCSGE